MIELLRDSIWTFIGTLAALAAIVVTITIYYGQRERKRLLIETMAKVPLLALGEKGIDGLRLTFQDQPLLEATVLLIRVTCVGNRPIMAADYDTSIAFNFAEDAQILSADVISTNPNGIPIVAASEGHSATLTRQLLNPGDSVTCRLLIKDSDGKYEVSGRIAGVKKIERTSTSSILPSAASIVAMVLIFGSYLLSPNPKSFALTDLRPEEFPYAFAGLAGFIVLMTSAISDLRSRLSRTQDQRRLIGHDAV